LMNETSRISFDTLSTSPSVPAIKNSGREIVEPQMKLISKLSFVLSSDWKRVITGFGVTFVACGAFLAGSVVPAQAGSLSISLHFGSSGHHYAPRHRRYSRIRSGFHFGGPLIAFGQLGLPLHGIPYRGRSHQSAHQHGSHNHGSHNHGSPYHGIYAPLVRAPHHHVSGDHGSGIHSPRYVGQPQFIHAPQNGQLIASTPSVPPVPQTQVRIAPPITGLLSLVESGKGNPQPTAVTIDPPSQEAAEILAPKSDEPADQSAGQPTANELATIDEPEGTVPILGGDGDHGQPGGQPDGQPNAIDDAVNEPKPGDSAAAGKCAGVTRLEAINRQEVRRITERQCTDEHGVLYVQVGSRVATPLDDL
jgi:hypothetical protein